MDNLNNELNNTDVVKSDIDFNDIDDIRKSLLLLEEDEEELKTIRKKLTNIQLLRKTRNETYINSLLVRLAELEPKVKEIETLENHIRNYEKIDEEKEKLIRIISNIRNEKINLIVELDEERDRNDNVIRLQVDEISFLQSSLTKLSKYENLYNTTKKEYKEYEMKTAQDLFSKSRLIAEHEKTIENLKKSLSKSESMKSTIESSLNSQIEELHTSNVDLKKQVSSFKKEIDVVNNQLSIQVGNNSKWEKAFVNIQNKVTKSHKEYSEKLKRLEKELAQSQDSDVKHTTKLEKLNHFLEQVNGEISLMNDISHSRPDVMRADLRAVSRSLKRLLVNNTDKNKQIPKVLRSIITFICNIINESMLLDEQKSQYSVDCINKDQAIESSSLLICNLKSKIQQLEIEIVDNFKIIHKSNNNLAEILQYCALFEGRKSNPAYFATPYESPISGKSLLNTDNEESIWNYTRNDKIDFDQDEFLNFQKTKCMEDLQTYTSALSVHVKLITDEIERSKSSEKCTQGNYRDLQLQLEEVINRYEMQLEENKSVHERELKSIWTKLRESLERVENLKHESDEAIKLSEENYIKKIDAFKCELNNIYMEKITAYDSKIKNYESTINELTLVKTESDFDLEKMSQSLDQLSFYFNHLLHQMLLSSCKMDNLISQKQMLSKNLNGFYKLHKKIHMTSLACSDPCCSIEDTHILICGSDGLPYKVSSLDDRDEFEYNHLYFNLLTAKAHKRPLPTLRVVTIVILAAIRFAKLQNYNVVESSNYSHILKSLPSILTCKHLSTTTIADMILTCARKWKTLSQFQNDCDNIFLGYFNESNVNSPTKISDNKSLMELIIKQKNEKNLSSEFSDKVFKHCDTPFWYKLNGITDVYAISKFDIIHKTLQTMGKSLRAAREREIELHIMNSEKENRISSIESKLQKVEADFHELQQNIDVPKRKNSLSLINSVHYEDLYSNPFDDSITNKESAEKRLLGIYENIGRLSEKSTYPKFSTPKST